MGLESFAEFTGYFSAEVVAQMEIQFPVLPMLAIQDDGKRFSKKHNGSNYTEAIANARKELEQIKSEHEYVFFAYEGNLTIEDKTLKVLVTIADDTKNNRSITIAQPYERDENHKITLIYQPKILEVKNIDNVNGFIKDFYEKGVNSQPEKANFWYKHLEKVQ